jgi:hypothetical protein
MGTWHDRAACPDRDPELFFDAHRETEALGVCAACPVAVQCLEDALSWEPRLRGTSTGRAYHGVRGGLTGAQRYELHRRHRQAATAPLA